MFIPINDKNKHFVDWSETSLEKEMTILKTESRQPQAISITKGYLLHYNFIWSKISNNLENLNTVELWQGTWATIKKVKFLTCFMKKAS